MALWGMTIDLDLCTGCQACVVACKAENNIPAVGPDDAARGRVIRWIDVVAGDHGDDHGPGDDHGGGDGFLPLLCQHCDEAPCTKVCPVHATYRNPEGIVAQIYPRCIGCRFCMAACPYSAKTFNWHAWQMPARGQNPDVSLRPKGVVEKCTFCHHRLQNARATAAAERRPLRDGDYLPACVEACPAGAMAFGDLTDPTSTVARRADDPRAYRLHGHLGTRPKVIYLAERTGRGTDV